MTTQAKLLQDQLDPTTKAVAAEPYNYPMAVQRNGMTYLMLSETKEIKIVEWIPGFRCTGLEALEKGEGIEIRVESLIPEIQRILSDLHAANVRSLFPIETKL